jgi:hypothetical protein
MLGGPAAVPCPEQQGPRPQRLEQFAAFARRGIRRLSVQAGSMATLITGGSRPNSMVPAPASPSRGAMPATATAKDLRARPAGHASSHASTLEAGGSPRSMVASELNPGGDGGDVSRTSSTASFVPATDAPEADAI